MSNKIKRNWSVEQKVQILQEAEHNGLTETLRKYNLSQSLFYKWKHKFDDQGRQGLEDKYRRVDPEKKALEQENKRLRELVGKLSLELEFKTELLKKTQF